MTPFERAACKLFPAERQIADRLHARPESKPTASWSGSGIFWNGRVGVCRGSHVFRACKRRARRSTPLNRYHQRMDYEWDAVVIGARHHRPGGRARARAARQTYGDHRGADDRIRGNAGVRRRARAVHRSAGGRRTPRPHRPEPVAVRPLHRRPPAGRGHGGRVPARQGTLEVASCPASGERLRAAASTLAAAGVEAEWIDGARGSAT